ncbi:hypothetical protein Acsp01_04240 [Actinoplanes sp. NBRC 101535]|nr:hypothetical protein Acsp01_04240 [Actinoplanes sp. NBRC 101535]
MRPGAVIIETAHRAAMTHKASTNTADFDAGRVPVDPTSTAGRATAARWLFFDRAIDSSFSLVRPRPVGGGTQALWGTPRAQALPDRSEAAIPCDAPAVSTPDYVPGLGSDEHRRNFLRNQAATFRT